jgi:hypothetical protein
MAVQTLFEKLQLKDEKNILIQGLPSSIEKQFIKLSFAKSITPLLKIKKVEFALLFAVSTRQLADILTEVMPALLPDVKLWIAYPKPTAKISSDLCRQTHWQVIDDFGLESFEHIELDNVWCACNFRRIEKKLVELPVTRKISLKTPAMAVS